jgi:hypothetical protein
VVVELAHKVILWAALLVQIGLFPSRAMAVRCLRRLREKKRVFLRDWIQIGDGHATPLYSAYEPGNHLEHDVLLSQVVFAFHPHMEILEPSDRNEDKRIRVGQTILCLEIDNGTEAEKILRKRLESWRDTTETCIWFAERPERLKKIMALARDMGLSNTRLLFVPIDEHLADPFGHHLSNFDGKAARISKPA